ncbi:high frequency lysogenization protein HflD [Streptomyces sp. CB01881]|uniref:high frequency lysogenization protein HflD n=1 Tax=Streptomyces sp. CB01881 TaxID=2078691 RepID=UPI0011DFF25A|nr:high frequency lysogenization protein HflD [Streptomyces sp. CB01881]TYC69364.1 high frequency lysogenization protein HflD [Streptomyces sp. CB01881]
MGVTGALCLLGFAAAADAHPLGNFSVNHYLGFTVRPDGIEVLAVTDAAEIPTLQEQPRVDRNGDGTVDDSERAAWAAGQCSQAAQRLQVTTDQGPAALQWNTRSAQFRYEDGSAGLRTSRLECVLGSALQFPPGGTTVRAASGSDPGRVGWNEITARGDGTTLDLADVPAQSVSRELRDYPRDLLNSPSGVTRAQFRVFPGGAAAAAAGTVSRGDVSGPTAWLTGLDSRLADLGAARHLTVPVGLLAVLLSIVLGAGHALLPGHGKTVMAAYLAGRRGRPRDAVTVGATVTLTHTAGVLVIGLCLTAFSSLAGDVLLGWLGVVSGALVALVGAALLREAVRGSGSGPQPGGAPDSAVRDSAARDSAHEAGEPPGELAHAAAAPASALHHDHPHPDGQVDHSHPHPHDGHDHHPHDGHDDHPHDGHDHHQCEHDHHDHHEHDHHHHEHADGHGPAAHHHSHEHEHRHGFFGGAHQHHHTAPGRRGLIGLGVAGGLVPSPSALVVLLGAIALGRTLFGAALVVAYGLGMAATLTAVGLLLVRLGDRIVDAADGPVIGRLRRIAPYTALLTAALILAVGVALVVRSLPSTL